VAIIFAGKLALDHAQSSSEETFALEAVDLRKSFGRLEIIRGLDFQVRQGERHAIIGPNGAGKSTLFGLLSGHYRPTGGEVRLFNDRIDGLPPYAIQRAGLSRSFQINSLFWSLSAFENIESALLWSSGCRYNFWRGLGSSRRLRGMASEVLELVGLTAKCTSKVSELTYAEQRALEIGMAIASPSKVVLLDEPTAGMSRVETDGVIKLIEKVSETRTLLMIEHDMNVVFGLADRISVLVYGKMIATDVPAAIRANPAVQEAYLGQAKEGRRS
jgi:branched-chain amino acid transport system ATP-binding protein